MILSFRDLYRSYFSLKILLFPYTLNVNRFRVKSYQENFKLQVQIYLEPQCWCTWPSLEMELIPFGLICNWHENCGGLGLISWIINSKKNSAAFETSKHLTNWVLCRPTGGRPGIVRPGYISVQDYLEVSQRLAQTDLLEEVKIFVTHRVETDLLWLKKT